MSTTASFVDYLCEQIRTVGAVRSKKMFGEYMVYVNDKPMFLVCDNTVYVKKHEVTAGLLSDAPTGFPYEGAKEHFIVDPDDAARCREVVDRLLPVTPVPKPKKKSAKANKVL